MVIRVYNDMTRKIEEFRPLKDNFVGMYVCGPTIYDYGHIGHARSAVAFDLIRRYLLYKGYRVKYVFNYTDIDDKIIKRANEEGISIKELTNRFAKIYDEDYAKLNVLEPDVKPKPSEEINAIINLIKRLEEKGFTYIIEGDGVYYDVSKFKDYGKLSHQSLEQLKAGARVEVDERKHNPYDFVLWKFKKPNEPSWPSPWGEGRPGWHIECSAMSMKYIGETLDIHGGGQDLIFPHHEDEIAQSEAATGKEFARYWMHNGLVQINKEKMSKSLGNFVTMRDLFKEYDPRVIRFFLISTHYRQPLNYDDDSIKQAKNSLQRIDDFIFEINLIIEENKKEKIDDKIIDELVEKTKSKFEDAMDDDFNISLALSSLFEFIKEINKIKQKIGKEQAQRIIKFMKEIDRVLGVMKFKFDYNIPEDIKRLVEERNEARKNKNWKKADEIRELIRSKGYEVIDTKDKTIIRKIE